MRLSIRQGLSIGAMVVALGGLTATDANASPASPVYGCHTDPNAYIDKDSSGNAAEQTYDIFTITGAYDGYIDIQLWYCPSYQSNFARAFYISYGPELVPQFVDLEAVGEWGGFTSATHPLFSNQIALDGSQDSPALYAPVEPVQACAILEGPDIVGGYECTQFV